MRLFAKNNFAGEKFTSPQSIWCDGEKFIISAMKSQLVAENAFRLRQVP